MISIDTPNLCLPQKRPKLPWNWNGESKKQGKGFFRSLSDSQLQNQFGMS